MLNIFATGVHFNPTCPCLYIDGNVLRDRGSQELPDEVRARLTGDSSWRLTPVDMQRSLDRAFSEGEIRAVVGFVRWLRDQILRRGVGDVAQAVDESRSSGSSSAGKAFEASGWSVLASTAATSVSCRVMPQTSISPFSRHQGASAGARVSRRGSPEGVRRLVAGGPGLVGDGRIGLRADPGDQCLGGHGHGEAPHLTREPVEHTCLDRTGVHIEADERTLLHSDASSRSRPAAARVATETRARLFSGATGCSIWSRVVGPRGAP